MMRCWRLVKARHAAKAWDGEGAYRYGGRWNSRGTRLIYTSQSLSLALLEILVHLDQSRVLPELVAFRLDIPQQCIENLSIGSQNSEPLSWPLAVNNPRQIGDTWIDQTRSLAFKVPSVVIPVESNILINPQHPDFKKIQIRQPEAFRFDQRL
ncbi:MAG: RES domain-containing protein [Puniceicoccaceae bacterium]|nr:MAG: RES domain-containing protein [Puniceicoccaceae bacterium]